MDIVFDITLFKMRYFIGIFSIYFLGLSLVIGSSDQFAPLTGVQEVLMSTVVYDCCQDASNDCSDEPCSDICDCLCCIHTVLQMPELPEFQLVQAKVEVLPVDDFIIAPVSVMSKDEIWQPPRRQQV